MAADDRPEARRRRRLSRSGEFDRVYREGTSRANRFLVLYAFPRGEEEAGDGVRLGVSVGRRVGGAVERNRVKRAAREAFWTLAERLPDGYDFVIVARPGIEKLVASRGANGVHESLVELLEDELGGERST